MKFYIFDNKESIEWTDFLNINRNIGDYCIDILSKYDVLIEILNKIKKQFAENKVKEKILFTIREEIENNGYLITTNFFQRLYKEGDFLFLYTFYEFIKEQYEKLILEYNPLRIDKNTKKPIVDEEVKEKCIFNNILKDINIIIKALKNLYVLFDSNNFENLKYLQEVIEPRKKTTYLLKKEDKYYYITEKDLKEKDFFVKLILYDIESPIDYLDVYISLIMNKKLIIKRCKNCNKFFAIYDKRSDSVYCDNPSPQNPEKKCSAIAPILRYRESIKVSRIKEAKIRTDQFFRTRKNRAKNKKEKDFYERKRLAFKKAFSEKYDTFEKNGEKKEEERVLIKWIISQEEGVKNECKRKSKK